METRIGQNETAIKSSSSGKTWIPLRNCWLMRVNRSYTRLTIDTMQKWTIPQSTKCWQSSTQCHFCLFLWYKCTKCGRQHIVWSERHTQIGRLTRRFVIHGLANSWICEIVDLVKLVKAWKSLKSVSVFLIDHSHAEVMKLKSSQSRWKVKSVNGEPFQSIPQFWHLQYTAQITPLHGAKSETCSRQKAVYRRCFHLELTMDQHPMPKS